MLYDRDDTSVSENFEERMSRLDSNVVYDECSNETSYRTVSGFKPL